MAKKAKTRQQRTEDILKKNLDRLVALNENSLIIELVLKEVPHHEIRKIVGVDMRRVTRISKQIKKD